MKESAISEIQIENINHDHIFEEHQILEKLKHYLPAQGPIKDFVHHNTLHAFQTMDFYDAIFKAGSVFGYKVTLPLEEYRELYRMGRIRKDVLGRILEEKMGKDLAEDWKSKLLNNDYVTVTEPLIGKLRSRWRSVYKADIDNWVQPLLFRIICSYLDQGVALWHFPYEDQGLLNALRLLEKKSFSGFFRTKRAKGLLFDENCTIERLLDILVGDKSFYEQYLFDQQFGHRGWSGLVAAVEEKPNSLLYSKKIELKEFVFLDLLLEIDSLDHYVGKGKWRPLCKGMEDRPTDLFGTREPTELEEVLKLWQDAFEWSYYDEVLSGVRQLRQQEGAKPTKVEFQAMFCIDDREDSLRRHLEKLMPSCETLGCPGFFGVEFYFQPYQGKFYERLCPAPVMPQYLIKEINVKEKRKHDLLYTKKTHNFFRGLLASLALGGWATIKMFMDIFNPKMGPAISNAFAHMNIDGELIIENKDPTDRENGLQIGFTVPEMAQRVEDLLRGMGMVKDFAPIVYVVGHGSSSANNPHHGAHDCGACSGRPGSVNARVFAFMANHPKVRGILAGNGLHIPDETQFVGGLHDTASDEIAFYDEKVLTKKNANVHERNKVMFEAALDLNAWERSRRFFSINTKKGLRHVRNAIRRRSVSLFEPRPELGHGTNSLCFIGNRELTKGLFLDRRAFLNNYDYSTDPDGKFLINVIKPIPLVCGGINLEYYFSRVDNYLLGAGTKLPHNVMGLIGVANSSDGDLRPGLPLQMIEVHDPVRLLILVEHRPEVVMKAIKANQDVYDWFRYEWVHLASIDPYTNKIHYFKKGRFIEYTPLQQDVEYVDNLHGKIESAKKMETNDTVDATQENLPVYLLKSKPVKS